MVRSNAEPAEVSAKPVSGQSVNSDPPPDTRAFVGTNPTVEPVTSVSPLFEAHSQDGIHPVSRLGSPQIEFRYSGRCIFCALGFQVLGDAEELLVVAVAEFRLGHVDRTLVVRHHHHAEVTVGRILRS